MLIAPFSNRNYMQVSFVVPDIQVAMEYWLKQAGVGPFFLVQGVSIEDQLYRGQPTSLDVSYALTQVGDVQLELVCQHNNINSVYRDTIAPGATGFHHVGVYTNDYDRDLAEYAESGSEVAFSGSFGGKRFCYVDTSAALGGMVELIEQNEAHDEFFARIKHAAATWDGRKPIRPAF